jgi:xylulokinase
MLLVIDIGTSNFKMALFDCDGTPYGNSVTVPMSIAAHEVESLQWLRAFSGAASLLPEIARTQMVVISGNGPTVVPVTGEPSLSATGELVLPAGMARHWLDRRAVEEAHRISEIVGSFVDPSFFLPKALAIKNREPELYDKTRYFLSSSEYLAYALTGEARTVFPADGFARWYWNNQVLTQAGLDTEKFPPFVSPGEVIGTVLPLVAARFGLPPKVKVVAGGPDFFVSILGTGAVHPGQVCDRSGTSEGINACTQNQIVDSRLMSYGHPAKPFWNLSGIISTSGKAIAWCRELLRLADAPYSEFYGLAASSEAGSGGVIFLPYLAGERAPIWNPKARGVFMGLGLDSGRAEMARAVVEGVCFAIRDVIAVMEDSGAPVKELRVTGGPSKSDFLNQLKADITGRPVLRPEVDDAELLGMVVIGATALGKYASFGQAADALVRIDRAYTPNRAHEAVYDWSFKQYRELYRTLQPQFEAYG